MLCNKCHIQYIWLVINYPYTNICISSIFDVKHVYSIPNNQTSQNISTQSGYVILYLILLQSSHINIQPNVSRKLWTLIVPLNPHFRANGDRRIEF